MSLVCLWVILFWVKKLHNQSGKHSREFLMETQNQKQNQGSKV